MGNSNSHQITPETANQVVFGQRPEMSPLQTLELINNLEKQINSIVQSSNIALVRVEDGIALAEFDQQLRQSKIIQRLDKDIAEKLVQIQLLHIRKHIHRDIFTTYTSDHRLSRDFPDFSETYLVDRDVLKLPSVAAYKLRLQQKENLRQTKLKQEQQRLDQLQQQKQKPIIKTTNNNNSSNNKGRVEATRQSRFNGPYQYVPRDMSPLGNNSNTHCQQQQHSQSQQRSSYPSQSQQQTKEQILPLPTARQTLPPPAPSAQSYADIYNNLVPPISKSPSNPESTYSNRSSTIFSSSDDNTNLTTFSNDGTNNSLANLPPPPVAPAKQDEHDPSGWLPAPDSPDFAESQKKHYMSLMSYLEPPSSGNSNNSAIPPFSPYTESVYSDFSVPDSIVDMSKFPEYRSHYINHYTPSGFQVVLNNDDIVSERAPSEAGDFQEAEASDVETIKEPVAPESPSLTEVFAQHAEDGAPFAPDSTKIEQRMSMIMQEVKPLVIREKASVIEELQPIDTMSTVQPVPSPESLPMPSPQSPLLSDDDMFVDAGSPPLTYDDLLKRTTIESPISFTEKPTKHVVIRAPSPALSPVPTLTPADSPVPELVAAAVANSNDEDNDDVIIMVPESAATAAPLPLSIPEQVEATDRAMVLPFLELEQKCPTTVAVSKQQPISSEVKVAPKDRLLPAEPVVPAAVAASATNTVAVARKKSTAPPPKKFRWSFNLFSSSNKKKSKAPASKHTKTKSMPNGAPMMKRAPSVQSRRSSTKRSGSIRRGAVPVQRMGSVRRASTVIAGSTTAAIAGAAMKRNGSLHRNASCRRAGSTTSSTSTGSRTRHRKTASSPANSASSFDFKQQRQPSAVSRRPSTARGAQRYRNNPPARAAGGSMSATSRPYRGSVYPIQPQPQAAPAQEYRMYTSRSGTLRRKLSDVSIASKLRDVNGDKTLLGQGIPPKVPLHSAKSLRRRGTGVGVAAAAAISADQLVTADAAVEQDGHQDTDKAMYDTQIYTRKCTFKRANKSSTDVGTAAADTKEEKQEDDVQILAAVASPSQPKSTSQFMLSGYEESSTRLKVVNRHNESALTTPQLGTTTTNNSVTAANLAHEFHLQNKLIASPNPAAVHLQAGTHRDKDQMSVRSMATTDTIKIQSQTNESLARAKKYFSWGPQQQQQQQQQALEVKKKRFMVPATNPLPDAKICDSPRLTTDAAGKRHTVLGTPGNVSKGYFFGLDILGTMDRDQTSTTGGAAASSAAGALSPTIRVVGRKSSVEKAKDAEENDDSSEGLFESLQNRRSIHLADAVEQSNRLWADRGALFYDSK